MNYIEHGGIVLRGWKRWTVEEDEKLLREYKLKKIEKEYLQYRKNGGWISFLTFAHRWLKENKEIIRKAIDEND